MMQDERLDTLPLIYFAVAYILSLMLSFCSKEDDISRDLSVAHIADYGSAVLICLIDEVFFVY